MMIDVRDPHSLIDVRRAPGTSRVRFRAHVIAVRCITPTERAVKLAYYDLRTVIVIIVLYGRGEQN